MGKISSEADKDARKKQKLRDNLARVQYLLYDASADFSDWEHEFLESVETRLKAGVDLTDNQEDSLARIEEKEF